ncbi:tRNA uridine(34) hydroxylase [Frankliniella fusca]|uniref:tRNA uridine(34) hydroxylase n=1 Tax=Frankliniella fusca TaxID=407009 RepID=A0AAE1LWP2_9NEOP|nr:tRNA uridine(34) hydroxylase [Frankliniella fusca]
MARLAVFALLAVVACASAFANPEPEPHGPGAQDHHGLRAWLHAKHLQISKWSHVEAAKLKTAWREKVVPEIIQLKQKLGKEWQKKAPQIVAALKQKAGVAFDKAVKFADEKISHLG